MSEHAPVMIWMSHPNGSCLHLNRMLRDVLERRGGGDRRASTGPETMHPDDARRDRPLDRRGDRRSKSSVTIKGRYRNAEGRYRSAADRRPSALLAERRVPWNDRRECRHRPSASCSSPSSITGSRTRSRSVQGIAHQTFKASDATAEARSAFEGRARRARRGAQPAHAGELGECVARGARRRHVAREGRQPRIGSRSPGRTFFCRRGKRWRWPWRCTSFAPTPMKYGALSNDAGRIELRLEPRSTSLKMPRLKLSWREQRRPDSVAAEAARLRLAAARADAGPGSRTARSRPSSTRKVFICLDRRAAAIGRGRQLSERPRGQARSSSSRTKR